MSWETLKEWSFVAPVYVNRVFACDCAERALHHYEAQRSGSLSDSMRLELVIRHDEERCYEVWDCLQTVRDFAEGREYSNEFMYAQWDRAMNIARRANRASRSAKVAVMWACVSYNYAHIAAMEAARAGAGLEWALPHFQHLLKEYNAARSTLLKVLSAREETIMREITKYARSLEERAFE